MLIKKSNLICIRFDFEGTHCWPEAPEEVAFLRNPHRHLFKVAVNCDVRHDDRELEFFILKKALKEFVPHLYKGPNNDLGRLSCEQMAESFCNYMRVVHKRKTISVEVSEDGENSAIVMWQVGA